MEKQLIYSKVAEVMKEIEPIAKERRNVQQNYNFRGIDELMNALSPIVTKHGIFPTCPVIIDVLHEVVTSRQGGAGTHLIRRYTFRFYAEDGSFVETMADGEAIDYGDKASNKAYSVAYREAIFKMFVIPFGNEDIEEVNHDVAAPKETPAPTKPAPVTKTNTLLKPKVVQDLLQDLAREEKMLNRISELCQQIEGVPFMMDGEVEAAVLKLTKMELRPQDYGEIGLALRKIADNK